MSTTTTKPTLTNDDARAQAILRLLYAQCRPTKHAMKLIHACRYLSDRDTYIRVKLDYKKLRARQILTQVVSADTIKWS